MKVQPGGFRMTTRDTIPAVCFIEDVCRALRISRREFQRMRRHGVFPIEPIAGLGMRRPRWSGTKISAFIEGTSGLRVLRQRRA